MPSDIASWHDRGQWARIALRSLTVGAGSGDAEHAPPSWHPLALGPAARLLVDWLSDTGQHAAAATLNHIEVELPPEMAQPGTLSTLGDMVANEIRAAALEERQDIAADLLARDDDGEAET